MDKIILFMDNKQDFLEVYSRFLEQAGYQVLRTLTLEEAEKKLGERRIHLAILDNRMRDENDERDTSGLLLAQREEFRSIPKIILTAYPSHEYVREALGLAPDGQPPAVNFLDKGEGPEALIQAVEQAFAQFVRVNWNLEIQYGRRERPPFFHLASLIRPDLPNDILAQRADELEDLIRRLFYDYQQIRIDHLLWSADRRFCLPVLALSSEETTDFRILVCGERERVEQERRRMEKLAPEAFLGTGIVGTAETMHFGATAYVLPNADVETVQTLRDLFHGSKARPIKAAFEHLLGDVLAAWHRHGQMVAETRDLMSLYRQWVGLEENGLSRTEVERRIEALVQAVRSFISPVDVERTDGLVTFRFPNQSPIACPDSVATVYAPLSGYDAPVVCRISPGRLTADNVLVDAGQRTWLTDFVRVGQAPQWWDFVCLEAIVRFDLSQAPDLLAWQEFEECLVKSDRLHERLRPQEVTADLQMSLALIERIRRQAGGVTGPSALPYYTGLLAWTVGAMARYDPEIIYTQADRMRGAHLFLAAAMISRRLDEAPSLPPLGGILKLDGNGTVWLGTHCAAVLMGLELNLLRCLCEHAQAGQPVSRRTIVESVYKEQYDASDKEQSQRITALVSRLRKKIEPDPGHPRYILTVRGKGYCLQVSGESEG